MKRFMYLSITLMCLSVTLLIGVHIGSQSAQAQSGAMIVGFTYDNNSGYYVIIDNGDIFYKDINVSSWGQSSYVYKGNFWGGLPVNVESTTWGAIKAKGLKNK